MHILWITAAISFGVSLLSKLLVDYYLTERIPIIGKFVGFQPAHNSGIAFSITFPGAVQTTVIAAAFILVIIAAMRSATNRLKQIGFGLIIGGALGNIVDRLRDGLVTDFIQISRFPIFNIPDSCITIGVAVLLIDLVVNKQKHSDNP